MVAIKVSSNPLSKICCSMRAFSNAVIATGKSLVTSLINPMFALAIDIFKEIDCPEVAFPRYKLSLSAPNWMSIESR